MNSFGLVEGNGPRLELIALSEASAIFYDERPVLKTVVRCVSRVYRGERIDACQVAKDLESAFRAVSMTPEIKVRAMTWRSVPESSEQELVEVESSRPSRSTST